jgi:peptidoglycan/xylan/chitin deacetylase (PgdA/CDA1 family)
VSGRALRWLLSSAGAGARPVPGPRLTIVRHHRVYADGEHRLYALGVSERVLAGQLETCAREGLVPVTVREGLEWLGRGEPGHRVAFTFDDGYADNVTRALPLLRRHGARATFYLTAGLMETRRAPWWDELEHVLLRGRKDSARVVLGGRERAIERGTPAGRRAALATLLPVLRVPPAVQRDRLDTLASALGVMSAPECELADWVTARALVEAGMEVGAHTLTHPFLSLLPAADQRSEMADSAALVRARLGVAVDGIAYPNGDHDAVTVREARAAGFGYAVVTAAGDAAPGDDAWTLRRRALTAGACTAPGGGYSGAMTRAELRGAFDALRGRAAEAAS